MLTKPSAELTLFDTLSRLTFTRAAKLLGPEGNRLIATGGKFDIDLATQVKFDRDMFRLTLLGATAHAAVDETEKQRHQQEAERLARRSRVAEAGGQLVAAAFAFLGEMIPQRQPTNGAEQKASEFKARLAECLERDEQGRPRLTVTLPNEAALESLARSLAALFTVTET